MVPIISRFTDEREIDILGAISKSHRMVRWEFVEYECRGLDECPNHEGECQYYFASIQVFCDGESCGLGHKTMDFEDIDDGEGLIYSQLKKYINSRVEKLTTNGKYLCDWCGRSDSEEFSEAPLCPVCFNRLEEDEIGTRLGRCSDCSGNDSSVW